MTQFKKGDRVRRIKGSHRGHNVGDTGTVERFYPNSKTLILVETLSVSHASYNFELVHPAFKVGDRVKRKKYGQEYTVRGTNDTHFTALVSQFDHMADITHTNHCNDPNYAHSEYELVGRTDKAVDDTPATKPTPTQDELNAAWVAEWFRRRDGVLVMADDVMHLKVQLGFTAKDVAAGFALYVEAQ